ncbi:MAG: hypothetical protein HXY20_14875 [Acidobacteria bacterium]|nr:hypothetical protein [Acidobacteriota bacterium]
MSEHEEIIRKAFAKYIEDKHPTGSLASVVQLLAAGTLSPDDFNAAIAHDYAFYREGLLDLVLYLIEFCIEDHQLSHEELLAVRTVKRLLHINEGDLYGLRRREIQGLMCREIDRILSDENVDDVEALHQARLQEVFDLGYDQYRELARASFDRVIDEKIRSIASSGSAAAERARQLYDHVLALDTVFRLSDSQKELLFGQPQRADEQPSSLSG